VGHPYYDMVDNSSSFENKIKRVVALVCKRIGKHLGAQMDDRLQARSRKRKFLIKSLPPVEVRGRCTLAGVVFINPSVCVREVIIVTLSVSRQCEFC